MVAGNEIDQRTLAAARLPHEGYAAAHRNGEIDVGEHFAVVLIAETHVVEAYLALQASYLHRVLHLLDGILGMQYLLYALHAGHTLLNGITSLAQVLDRLQGSV